MSVSTEPKAGVRATPLVARIYGNQPCLAQNGGRKIVYDAVVDLGDAGPVLLFWQCSARTASANRTLEVQPVVNNEAQTALRTATHVNPANVHAALLRRRALVKPLPQGQSFFAVQAGEGVVTDRNDTVNMVALDISDMARPPQIRLDAWGFAGANNIYAEKSFTSSGGPLVISSSVTGRAKKAGQFVQAVVYLDSQPIAVHQLFANHADQHVAMVGADRVITVPAGNHTLRVAANEDTVVDKNDYWSLTVMEMEAPSSATTVLENAKCESQQGDAVVASGTYESKGGQHMICLSLSGYSNDADRTLTARVLVGENPVGRLQVHANQAATHMVFCGGDIAPGAIPAGKHTISVVAGSKTVTDVNDRCSLTVIEVYR